MLHNCYGLPIFNTSYTTHLLYGKMYIVGSCFNFMFLSPNPTIIKTHYQGCRDMRYIAIFFSHIAIQTCMGYTEIDGRIDGERRKYTKSHSAAATSVVPHTYHSNSAAVLRTCIHIYCKFTAPIEINIIRIPDA